MYNGHDYCAYWMYNGHVYCVYCTMYTLYKLHISYDPFTCISCILFRYDNTYPDMYGQVRVRGPAFKDNPSPPPLHSNTELYNLFCSLLGSFRYTAARQVSSTVYMINIIDHVLTPLTSSPHTIYTDHYLL